jgi:hypothetical protein
MGQCDSLHLDGTFQTCPRPFHQLYVIQGRYRGRILPLGFALMKRKRRAAYRAVFQALTDRFRLLTGAVLAPRLTITDFEALRNNFIFYLSNFVEFHSHPIISNLKLPLPLHTLF